MYPCYTIWSLQLNRLDVDLVETWYDLLNIDNSAILDNEIINTGYAYPLTTDRDISLYFYGYFLKL